MSGLKMMKQSSTPSIAIKRQNFYRQCSGKESKRHKSNSSCEDHCSSHRTSQTDFVDSIKTLSSPSTAASAHAPKSSITSDTCPPDLSPTSSIAATPCLSSSSFQQSPSISSLYSYPSSQDIFGLLTGLCPQEDQVYAQCGGSEPCTDPTCLDACPDVIPCHSEDDCFISGDCFGIPCWDTDCIGEFGGQDICCSEECPPETRCESPPCYKPDCHVPICESFCPTAGTSSCHTGESDYQNFSAFQDHQDSSFTPQCGCIDPQCLSQPYKSCDHAHDTVFHPRLSLKHRILPSDLNSTPTYHLSQNTRLAPHESTINHYQGPSYSPAGHSSRYTRTVGDHLKEEPYSPQPVDSKVQYPLGALDITSEDALKRLSFQAPQSHTRTEVYQCQWCHIILGLNAESMPICGETFSTSEELHQHVEKMHVDCLPREDKSGNGFYCHWVGCDRYMSRSFQARPKLKRHVQTHTSYKPFMCSKCGVQMKTKDAMEKHERTHTGERPYECTIPSCGKVFATSTELKTHMTIHEGRKPHQCPICQECFADSSNLSKHKKTHYAGRYVCPDCGARMKRWDQMRRHIATQQHAVNILHDKRLQQDYKARMEKEFSEMPDRHRILDIKDTR